ncbi:MAG: DUF3987 domain-containing protein [Limimaricola sp.]|uniref:YfjI family protein n=1 Tax=Limimaricola sp. TaxID=2211665 RepID=UPI001D812AD0|nr:YfjI family protein [Limimaricola sp.]MBI1417973.1 DUF3987 domain-containing protein [Limimaricola sp.]
MNVYPNARPFVPDWPEPAPRFMRDELPPAPALRLAEVFGLRWADWITRAAEAKSAPPDYVMAAVLAVAGSAIGNTRLVAPWAGWAEPPILWTMVIGSPSSNKSPGLDAVLSALKLVERDMRQGVEAEHAAWAEKDELAKLAESAWKEAAKKALKDGEEPPKRPAEADPGPEPFLPRLSIADGTVERLAVIVAKQPRGTLMARDELAGWLMGMTRYAGGGSDRPFWLEAYGGRGYTVERMGREPVHVDRLSIGVTGGIQPDRLRTLLMKADDDGLLARFIPIWPDPVPIKRPTGNANEDFIAAALSRLYRLNMATDEHDELRPWLIPFTEEARVLLDAFRHEMRGCEGGAEGLLLSFIGKLPGLAVRLSLVLAFLDWVAGSDMEPYEITPDHFGRAAHFVEDYALPMARRAYADAALPKPERAARRLLALIQERGWERFTSREVLRLDRAGLTTAAELKPALSVLEEADVIRSVEADPGPRGGRPAKLFMVNPAIMSGSA